MPIYTYNPTHILVSHNNGDWSLRSLTDLDLIGLHFAKGDEDAEEVGKKVVAIVEQTPIGTRLIFNDKELFSVAYNVHANVKHTTERNFIRLEE